jgi:hypothetical protein
LFCNRLIPGTVYGMDGTGTFLLPQDAAFLKNHSIFA